MAEEQSTIIVAQMQSVAFAIAPILAMLTFVALHPAMVAMCLEAMFPHVHEVVFIDIALTVVIAYAGTGTNATVNQDGGDCDTRSATEQPVAHIAFIRTQKAFASIRRMDAPFLTCLLDELKQSAKLFFGELQAGILRPTAYWEDGGKPPLLHALADEIITQGWQLVVVMLMHTSHDIVCHPSIGHHHVDGLTGHAKTVGVTTQPRVLLFKSVETDSQRAEPGPAQLFEERRRKKESIGDHPPGEASVGNALSALHHVFAHERFAPTQNDKHLCRVQATGDIV